MKKLLQLTLATFLTTSLLTGCSTSNAEDCPITIGLVTNDGGVDDKSYNEGTWNGVKEYYASLGLDYKACATVLESNSEADYIPNFSQLADDQFDIIMGPGFVLETAIESVAKQYPDQKFLIIDGVVDQPNVMSALFAEHEGSFVTGIAAGLVAKEAGQKHFGFIGGIDFELIQRFEAGFIAGVRTIIPDATFEIQYAGDFNSSEKGKTIASKMFDQGAYIIFHAAGGTGNGLIEEAKSRRANGADVWAIGVDTDQYEFGKMADGSSAVLTSMMKRVDVTAFNTATMVADGTFTSSINTFDLSNGGVGVELTKGRSLSDEIIDQIEVYYTQAKNREFSIPTTPDRLK